MNLKVEELISQLAWSTAHEDGKADADKKASESEKNIVRAFRKCFSISTERFNELLVIKDDELIAELAKQDPVSKLIAIYTCLAVAHAETEALEDTTDTLSDKEWSFIYKIIKATRISKSARDAVRDCVNRLVRQLTDIDLLNKDELSLTLIKIEIESGKLAEKHIIPLLTKYFDSVEAENDLIRWEEDYLALKRNKRALTRIFGDFSIKKWDTIYDDLKFNLKELKKSHTPASAPEKKSAIDKEILKQEKENKKLAEKEKLNKTHDISSSKGIMYCRFCGELLDDIRSRDECKREYGHKYSIKRVERFSYDSIKEFENRPVCSKCGKVGRCGSDWCS